MSVEAVALNVINEINKNLKLLHHINCFLIPTLTRLLCNVLIQHHFDYEYSARHPNLTKKLKQYVYVFLLTV